MTNTSVQDIQIRLVTAQDLAALEAHLKRHFSESGRTGFHFFPYAPDDPNGPSGIDIAKIEIPTGEPKWQRWFMAVETGTGKVCGHVDLKGYALRTSSHRCLLGIGIEEEYRAMGLGKRLMQTGIDFARNIDTVDWLDLMVFAHNTPARKLYASLGFEDTGYTKDLFRIGTVSIDDVSMTLNVATSTR